MRPDIPKLLEDIRDSCEFILSSAASLSLAEFNENRTIRQAVERNFEIIGEALNRIKRSDPAVIGAFGDISRIIAFRNILAHGYDVVDNEVVWLVVKNNVPRILEKARQLLDRA